MRSEWSFESAWRVIQTNAVIGEKDDTGRGTGVKRISAIRELPGVVGRFHTMFPQDPMHDFAEGILAWFIMRVFREHVTTFDAYVSANSRFEAAKRSIDRNLKWPTLKESELRGTIWHLNGIYLFEAFH